MKLLSPDEVAVRGAPGKQLSVEAGLRLGLPDLHNHHYHHHYHYNNHHYHYQEWDKAQNGYISLDTMVEIYRIYKVCDMPPSSIELN